MVLKLMTLDKNYIAYDHVTHFTKTDWYEKTEVVVMPSATTLELPRDGYCIFVMNDRGDTIDRITYAGGQNDGNQDA